MRQILALTTAAAVSLGGFAIAPAQAMPVSSLAKPSLGGGLQQVRWHGGWHRGWHRGGWGLGGLGLGLATGAILGGALANGAYGPYEGAYGPYAPYRGVYAASPEGAGYCGQRFRSYDPASGTYLGYDGMRHPCP